MDQVVDRLCLHQLKCCQLSLVLLVCQPMLFARLHPLLLFRSLQLYVAYFQEYLRPQIDPSYQRVWHHVLMQPYPVHFPMLWLAVFVLFHADLQSQTFLSDQLQLFYAVSLGYLIRFVWFHPLAFDGHQPHQTTVNLTDVRHDLPDLLLLHVALLICEYLLHPYVLLILFYVHLTLTCLAVYQTVVSAYRLPRQRCLLPDVEPVRFVHRQIVLLVRHLLVPHVYVTHRVQRLVFSRPSFHRAQIFQSDLLWQCHGSMLVLRCPVALDLPVSPFHVDLCQILEHHVSPVVCVVPLEPPMLIGYAHRPRPSSLKLPLYRHHLATPHSDLTAQLRLYAPRFDVIADRLTERLKLGHLFHPLCSCIVGAMHPLTCQPLVRLQALPRFVQQPYQHQPLQCQQVYLVLELLPLMVVAFVQAHHQRLLDTVYLCHRADPLHPCLLHTSGLFDLADLLPEPYLQCIAC